MAKKRTYRDDVTDPVAQQALFESAELRDERQSTEQAKLPIPRKPLRGRGRPALIGSDVLPLAYGSINKEALVELDKSLAGNRPVFDKFTRGNWVTPTPEAVERYVTAPNRRNRRLATATTTEQKQLIRANMRRQVQDVADRLVKGSFINLQTARQRGVAVEVVRFQLWNGLDLDPEAVSLTADAVEDFGHSLADKSNRGILESTGHVELADQIIGLGQRIVDTPDELAANPEVLAMVSQEQVSRVDAWSDLFSVANETLKPVRSETRLPQIELQQAQVIDEQIARFESLMYAPAS